jgi:hypothetical protein
VALLALVTLLGAQRTATAVAADGLPPGVPVPAWAKGKRVHFDPAEPQNTRLAGDDAGAGEAAVGGAAASSAKARPLTSSPPRLLYHGGTIQNEPHLMLVFLGEEWESGSALVLRRELEATAESLPGSNYQRILTQYSGLDGPISSPLAGSPVIEKYYVKQPITTKINSYAARRAAQEVIEHTGGSEKTDTTYAILPAPGTAEVESRTCGFHEEYGAGEAGPSIAVIMDTEERIGCGDTTQTLTHEYAESVTDPNGVSGWNTGEGVGGDEIGDICNELGPGRLADGARVAYLWDDSRGACETEDSDPGSLPIGPYTETSHDGDPSLEGATNLTPESETIETSIYPCDLEAHYYFEYGTTEAYGHKTAESVVPAGWGAVKVNTTLTGLQHGTPYHWRVVVKTGNGSADGVDHEFTIPYYAEVKGEETSDVGLTEATLNGEVRPVGVETKYYFEYDTTTAYGSKTAETSVGSGGEFVAVSAPLTGLAPGTSYHYRLVATNSRGDDDGKRQRIRNAGRKADSAHRTDIYPRLHQRHPQRRRLRKRRDHPVLLRIRHHGSLWAAHRRTRNRGSGIRGRKRSRQWPHARHSISLSDRCDKQLWNELWSRQNVLDAPGTPGGNDGARGGWLRRCHVEWNDRSARYEDRLPL